MSSNDDNFTGEGNITKPNGAIYKGYFTNGKLNGEGIFTYQGHTYKGNFVNDKRQGQGTFTFNNGDIYEGNSEDSKFNGQGKLIKSNGDIYEGNFKDNLFNGKGTLKYKNGDKYEGNFKNNKFNGQGKLTYNNGKVRQGNFEDGKYLKPGQPSNLGTNRTQSNLDEINKKIRVFDQINSEQQSASIFFEKHISEKPFIIRSPNGLFSGDAIDRVDTSPGGKFFAECSDDADEIKEGARLFFKIKFIEKIEKKPGENDVIIYDVKYVFVPEWFNDDKGTESGTKYLNLGTKYFKLVEAGEIIKFMSVEHHQDFSLVGLSRRDLGAEHCEQETKNPIYQLQEMTLAELNTMVSRGGKKYKKQKTKHRRKSKKQKTKHRRKSKKYRITKKKKK
jgi:hypothetical protein